MIQHIKRVVAILLVSCLVFSLPTPVQADDPNTQKNQTGIQIWSCVGVILIIAGIFSHKNKMDTTLKPSPRPKPVTISKIKKNHIIINNVAVSDFVAKNTSAMDASITADFFRTALIKSNTCDVIDKSDMDLILAEAKFQQSGCTEADCAVKLGKILNVKYMYVGSLSRMGHTYFISINLIDVETGRIIKSEDGEAESAEQIKNITKLIANKLIEK
jgi:TolB-like protein